MDHPCWSMLEARIRSLENHGLGNIDAIPATARLALDVLARGIPGSMMECGVAAGAHPAAMAMACEIARDPRTVYLCDSFDGIPRPGPRDAAYVELLGPGNGELESTGVAKATRAQVEQNMRTWDVDPSRLVYVEGWFQHTLYPLAEEMRLRIERLAMLRIDANLYESVACAMDAMAPFLSRGAVLVLDDYRSDGGREAIDTWLATHGIKPEFEPVSPGDKDSAVYCIVDWGF